jgi:sulfatase maturation enzyme AslB (radical SAM superfamily)
MLDLETVWFQITGTLCNLTCTHCFVECSPTNHAHEFMTLEQMRERMDEAVRLGAREFAFTGGEPFMHPEIIETLECSLARARTLVLSNATLFRPKMAGRLREMLDRSSGDHEFEVRVSLDGVTAEQNDSVRGEGSFERAMTGIRNLLEVGIRPTVATTGTWGDTPKGEITRQMQRLMAEHGVENCSIKIFPNVLLGAEEQRLRSYREVERVTAKCVEGADPRALMCSNSRLVTERGVWVCTLLANVEGAKMGETVEETLRPFKITQGACFTCFTQGVRCSAE